MTEKKKEKKKKKWKDKGEKRVYVTNLTPLE